MRHWAIWLACMCVMGYLGGSAACTPVEPTEKREETPAKTDAGKSEPAAEPAAREPASEPAVDASEPASTPDAQPVERSNPPEPQPEPTPDRPAPPPPAKPIVYYTLTVRGKLKGTVEDAKKVHNKIIADTKDAVTKLGDMAHTVYLGAQDKKEFLAIDVWRSLDGLNKFLQDPNVQKNFGELFESAPTITVWKNRGPSGWKQYWENDVSGKAHIRVMVQGKLKGTVDEARKAHNKIIEGSVDAARQLGDLSHHVFENPKEPTDFLAFDVWNNPQGLDKFFKDPNVQKSFGELFSAPPTISTWQKADDWTPITTDLYTVTVQGKLKGTVDEAKKVHNQIIAGSSGIARQLGDLSHDVYLGAQDKTQFLAIDVWYDSKGLNQFLQDPNVQKSFGALFSAPPTITVSVERKGWKQYWENDLSGKAHIRVMVQGKLKGTVEEGKAAHNKIIEGSVSAARQLGDLSHHVYENPKAPTDFLAFDVWNNPQGLDKFFKDPNVQQSFGALFSAPPTISTWQKADGWDTY